MLVVTHEMQFAREIADRVVCYRAAATSLEVAPPAEFSPIRSMPRARRFSAEGAGSAHQESLGVTPIA